MDAASGGKIATRWDCNAYGMLTFRVHQTDYPEIEAEGRTPAEARGRLLELLAQALDFASEAWRCRPLAMALSDARDFNGSFAAGARTEPRPSLPPPGSPTRTAGRLSGCRKTLDEEPVDGTLPR